MLIGMNLFLWTTHVADRHFPILGDLSQTGFDLVEIPVSDYSAAEVSALRGELQQSGLACTTATLLDADHNPIADDPRVRAAALDKLKADIDLSAELGSLALIGPMHSGHKVFHGRGPTAQEFERCVEVLGKAAEYAASAGIELSVEFLNRFECYFANTTAQMAALAETIDYPALGVLYDTHHANIEESDIGAAIREHRQQINHIHISESHRGTPGTGSVDWQSTFEALKAIGYDGRIVIEAFGTDVADVVPAVNIWRDCFESKQQVYQQGLQLIKNNI